MTCTQLRTHLQDYARGNMSAEGESAFEAHLDSCEDCATIVALAEPALRQAGTLPRTVPPVQDLWPAIHARIGPAPIRGRIAVPRWVLAAAATLLVAMSSAVTAMILQSVRQPVIQSSSHLAGLEAEYSAASDDLAAVLAAARGRLAPETILTIERNLALIDNALAESRRALAGDPGNQVLEQLVVAAWRQKVDLLRRATTLSGET